MKKKIIFITIFFIVIALLFITVLFIFNQNNKNQDKPSKEEFSRVLQEFDYVDDITINEEIISTNSETNTYKLDGNKTMITTSNNEYSIYFYKENQISYKVFYEDSFWKRKIVDENESIFKISFNLAAYIDKYDMFSYDNKSGYLELIEFDDKSNIQILIRNGKVKNYNYKQDDKTYRYGFSYYKNTIVEIPSEVYNIYEKLDLQEWNQMILKTTTNYNFSLSSIYQDKIGDELYYENAVILKNDMNKVYKSISLLESKQEFYYELNSNNEFIYTNESGVWKLESTISSTKTAYNQYEQLPINILNEYFDKVEYNEFDSTYTLKNILYDNKNYSQVIFKVFNGYISYVAMDYTYILDDVVHNVRNIMNFTDFEQTEINLNIS